MAAGGVPDGPRWPVSAVAHRLGVAPATLRTWARRYGLGPSGHAPGAQRRYTATDIRRLEAMRRLVLDGVAPAEAARVAAAGPAAGRPAAAGTAAAGTAAAGPTTAGVAGEPAAGPLPDREGRLRTRGGPGGRVLALPGADGVVRGLGRAALAMDAAEITRMLRAEVEERGVLHTWEHVLRPVLVAVGERWERTGHGVEVEHLLSDCAAAVLRPVAHRASEVAGGRPVLLACAPDEQHVLPLHAVAAALAQRGTASRTLGAALPVDALQAAVRRTGPAMLFLWSQLPATAARADLDALPVTRPPTSVVVGGPGWTGRRLPERVAVATDLPSVVELAERAVGR